MSVFTMIMIIVFPGDTTYPEGFLNPGDVRESVAFLDIEHQSVQNAVKKESFISTTKSYFECGGSFF